MGFASVGRSLPGGISVGASLFGTAISAIDGVDLLYAGSSNLDQHGWAGDVRVGLLKEWAGSQSLEALVLFDRYRVTHDVTFLTTFWDPATQAIRQTQRAEHHADYTDNVGFHLGYQMPIGRGVRAGAIATTNRRYHPKLPNYDIRSAGIVATPWDPGDSRAYNFGLGASWTGQGSTLAAELVYEPIWTYTWGEAAAATPAGNGTTIQSGGKTIENHFVFSNWRGRMGASRTLALGNHGTVIVPQLGLSVHATRYWLDQVDHVLGRSRFQVEDWREWTRTWGVVLKFPELEIRYQGRVTTGLGRPGINPVPGPVPIGFPVRGGAPSSVFDTPSGPMNLTSVSVGTHMLTVSVPIAIGPRRGGSR